MDLRTDINIVEGMNNIGNVIFQKELNELSADEQRYVVKELVDRLLIEHKKNDKSGIYGVTQYSFAYNSNHMEGSTLTENQTRDLFETGILPTGDEIYKAKHVEEATGHFMMFNEMLHSYEKPLSEENIKQLHYRLKIGVFEDMANGYPCGAYKNRVNKVSDIETAHPLDVEQRMKELLDWYNNQPRTIDTIAAFHARYENIHPFQDGNGRTGRMIVYRECIRFGIIPSIIKEQYKPEYSKALNHAQHTGDCTSLVEVLKKGQELYYKEMQKYLVVYPIQNKKQSR